MIFFFQAEDGIRDVAVTGVQTCALPICTLVRFDGAQLAAGGAPVPAVVLSGLGHPTALAFDGDGSLWVSDNVAQTIAKYRGADLTASGSPAPAVVLTETENAFPLPLGLAFDADGNLWVANLQARNVVAFSPAQLAVTGAPTPQVVLSSTDGSLALPVGLAFDAEGSLWVVGGAGTLTKRSEEHTSELQSRLHLVCRLLLEKKKKYL